MAAEIDISKAPQPEAGESMERYTIRAHKALMSEIPDPEQRNELIWKAWEKHCGPQPEREIADRSFPADRFTLSAGHTHFCEHETVAKDGSPRKYTVRDLVEIARQHNSEIRESQHFPALSEGHTPENPEAPEPRLLGHAGPYRIGMIGRDKPRFALFADEYHRQDAADVLNAKPFRSVELWTFKDGRRRFHPIAAVGTESPRLLMPAKYSADNEPGQFDDFQHDGSSVERYTVAALGPDVVDVEHYDAMGGGMGAMAGGSNTFVKGPVKSKEKYADDDPDNDADDFPEPSAMPKSPEVQGPETPEGIRAIMQAIQSTPEFQFLRRLMEEDESMAGNDEGEAGGAEPGAESPLDEMGGQDKNQIPPEHANQPAPGPADTSDLNDVLPPKEGPAGVEPEKHSLPSEGISPSKAKTILSDNSVRGHELTPAQRRMFGAAAGKENHSMSNDDDTVSVERYRALEESHRDTVEKYAQLSRSHNQLIESQKRMHGRLEAMEREATDQRRRSVVEALGQKSAIIDVEEELKATLYSLGSNMNDEQFKAHIANIEKYSERANEMLPEQYPMLPRGVLPERYTNRAQAEVEKYEERLSAEAVKVHDEALNQGRNLDWESCQAEAKKRIGQNGHAAATN